jgi:hypothetical protein
MDTEYGTEEGIMKRRHISLPLCLTVVLFALTAVFAPLWAGEEIRLTHSQVESYKAIFDDPSPLYKKTDGLKKVLPPDIYKQFTYDVEAMKTLWAETVGFKASDVVGKIVPEIKPGTYTLQDKKKYPFDKLMWGQMYNRFNPPGVGTPNHVGNFTEFEVVPTRQYFWSIPVAEATKKNAGTVKQDAKGYLVEASYVAGYPFPRPAGPFKAQQIMYNWVKRYAGYEAHIYYEHPMGINKNFTVDHNGLAIATMVRLASRVQIKPLGYFDERAKAQGEHKSFVYSNLAPRDLFGNIISETSYTDPNRFNLLLMYINSLRRMRKLSASDAQDPAVGQDMIYEDAEGFNQKLTPSRYPYKYEVTGEQEYLVPYAGDGSAYISSKEKFVWKKLQFERRPMWIVLMTGLDKNYVYSKRIFYVDKETLLPCHMEYFDQKGRLYRTYDIVWGFIPELAHYEQFQWLGLDHVDVHSSYSYGFQYPAPWATREDISLDALVKAK